MELTSFLDTVAFATLCTLITILFWITLFQLCQSWYLATKQNYTMPFDDYYSDLDTVSVHSEKTLVNHALVSSLPE
jgi:hypothetical protein